MARIIKLFANGECRVLVRFDPEYREYSVTPAKGERNGDLREIEAATYFTDDRTDALQTATRMLAEMTED